MRYHELLADGIEKQGLQLKEVEARCKSIAQQQGWTGPIKLDVPTLSRLRDGKQLPPTEPAPGDPTPSRNRLLAKALGIPEEPFVLAAAIEHTPLPVLGHISTMLTSLIRSVADAHGAVHEAATDALMAVSDAEGLPANCIDLCNDGVHQVNDAVERAQDAVGALLWFTAPYVNAFPYDGAKEHAENVERHRAMFQGMTINTLTKNLATAAGIDSFPLTAFVAAMRTVEARKQPTEAIADARTSSAEG